MKNLSHKMKIELLGKTGEKIIANELSKQGFVIEHSINNFDSEKDLLVNGKKIEIKTEQPYVLKNSITIRETQLKKCRSVDFLFFVTVPPLIKRDYKWGGWIFQVDPKSFVYEKYTTKSGIKMISISILQDAVTPVRELDFTEKNELKKYAVSDYAK